METKKGICKYCTYCKKSQSSTGRNQIDSWKSWLCEVNKKIINKIHPVSGEKITEITGVINCSKVNKNGTCSSWNDNK